MSIRILLVDDDLDFLKQSKVVWEKEIENVNVDTTTSPKEALEKMESGSYDCIVADYKMPDMTGLELLEKVRKKNEDILFGLLTGKGGEDVAIDAINLKADMYIKKETTPKSQFETIMDNIFERSIS